MGDLGELLGASGAGCGHSGACVPALCAADGWSVPLPVSPESLQPQTAAGSGGPLLRPPVPGQGQNPAGSHL